jgi:hypothetical protein
MRKNFVAILCISMVALAGCDSYQQRPSGDFSLTASSDGAFLLDKKSGKVWRYTASGEAFKEIPVSQDTLLMRTPTGELEAIPLSQVKDYVRKGGTVEKNQDMTDYEFLMKVGTKSK